MKKVTEIAIVGVGHFGSNLLSFLLNQEGVDVKFCVEQDLKRNHATEALLQMCGSNANVYQELSHVGDEPDFVDVIIDCSRDGLTNRSLYYQHWGKPVIYQASEERVVSGSCPVFTNESKVNVSGRLNDVKIPHCSSLIIYEILKNGSGLNDLRIQLVKNFGPKIQTHNEGPEHFITKEIELLLADNCPQHKIGIAKKFTQVNRMYLPNLAGTDNVYAVSIQSANIKEKVRKLRLSNPHLRIEEARQISDHVDDYLHIQSVTKHEVFAYAFSPELAINWNMRALNAYANAL